MFLDPKTALDTAIRTRTNVFSIQTDGLERKGLWEFFDHLFHYKSRHLSYDSDSINSFQGILAKSPYLNIWGILVACSLNSESARGPYYFDIGFARGLWWEHPDHWQNSVKEDEELAPFR